MIIMCLAKGVCFHESPQISVPNVLDQWLMIFHHLRSSSILQSASSTTDFSSSHDVLWSLSILLYDQRILLIVRIMFNIIYVRNHISSASKLFFIRSHSRIHCYTVVNCSAFSPTHWYISHQPTHTKYPNLLLPLEVPSVSSKWHLPVSNSLLCVFLMCMFLLPIQ